jgi:Type ISP C-terminal specificity domain/N-6 DNA Methylase
VSITEYLSTIKANLVRGDATEHTHRPALKALLESQSKGIIATNEPKRIACGAPDFIITRQSTPLGHVETKDVGTNLDEIERGRGPHGEQFKRYIEALPNWILTDYLEFRWYVGGEKRITARFASLEGNKKIHVLPKGDAETTHLLQAFFSQPAPTVDTAKDLASRMAGMTGVVRDLITATFKYGSAGDRKQLVNWLTSFREVLIPDLDEAQFSDMFAQTLAYGLFAARVHSLNSNKPFTREMATFALPKTNPFLRRLFSEVAGVDMPDTFGWAVDDIVLLLNHANWGKVLKDFGEGKAKHDPVVHFYETFLAAYDPEIRELRGVYYTPEPVVSYIVRSVEHLLKQHFDKPKGLADEGTLILDPAVGTATFPFFVIQQIHAQFAKQKGAWNSYVSEHLLNRLFGFELLMAPYAVAHLKLGLELQRTGYKFGSEQRLGIYLTNTLEEAAKKSEKLFAQWISDEANAAAEIKRTRPILVILGNPPYSGHSANRSRDENGKLTFIGKLIEDYKMVDGEPLGEKNPKWLQDDYVKFIRFAQWRIERTGHGILGFITNHRYLYNPTFRGMRQQLMQSFNEIHIYDLHGNSRSKERAPDGSEDKNVFDIQQGVAIILAVRKPGERSGGKVHHADLWGEREEKYAILSKKDVTTTEWKELTPTSPDYLLTPGSEELRQEYSGGWLLSDAMPVNSIGVVTARDSLTIHFTPDEVWKTVQDFVSLPVEEARSKYKLGKDVRDWKVEDAQKDLRATGMKKEHIVPILYRPFDARFTYYTGKSRGFHCYPRREVMAHMLAGPNIGLATSRNVEVENVEHFFCSQYAMGHHAVSLKEVNFLYPLYLYAEAEHDVGKKSLFAGKRLNFSGEFLSALAAKLKRKQGEDGLPESVSGEDIAAYAYAVFYSPSYRTRYEEFLRRDFPRLPLTSVKRLFADLAARGRELMELHLMRAPELNEFITEFPIKGENLVQEASYNPENQRVSINGQQYFGGVPKNIWEFQFGGFQVCEQWIKDRKGRNLTYDDLQHWQRIVVAIKETMRITAEIDALIPGWPLP